MSKSYEHLLSEIPESADYCREFQNDVRTMFVIDSVYLEKMRYVAINQLDNQPYILHTKVIGMWEALFVLFRLRRLPNLPKEYRMMNFYSWLNVYIRDWKNYIRG